ncbi:hypothetical protein GQX73_g9081 [Xylaria multiplex]|uniref:U1-type domain-containing protein n=1 Tax=Xylaria multiplex TaxID=323545 RepID=A0A7C8IND2_9PEZI|nr:hypothetical protein GQX73_g9081 [Xylaria multiplex]
MQLSLALLSALLGVAIAAPQGVTEKLTPTGAAPAGCTGTVEGKFEITVARVTEQKRSIPEKRAECGSEGTLVITLEDGSTYDAQGRTGYIASNYQFQFDAPAQAGALFTSGFSVCKDNIMALGSSKTFYQCLSGDFYNLYDRTWAAQCEPVSIIAIPCGSEGSADQSPDGQVVGTTVVQTTIITALPDGQPQVITTSLPVPIYSTYVPVSEYTDGQIQVTPTGTAAPPPPPETTPAVTSPATSPAPTSAPVSSPSISVPVESPPVTTPATTSSVPATTFVSTSSTPASSSEAPPATTSAPGTGGSSHVAAGSMGALVVGNFKFFYLGIFNSPLQTSDRVHAVIITHHIAPIYAEAIAAVIMSEYWKSTPKYWCKHCSLYVRDTKLERTNHEATAKHQSGLKRFLRDIHRGHENEQREKERARREIDRLNGITTKPSASTSASSSTATVATAAQRQQQWEQLAEMGIDVPTELRGDMALAGEWSVTSTRIVDDAPNPDDNDADTKPTNVDAIATGLRKRPKQEDEDDKEDEEGLQNLFKKPRRWGRDSKQAAGDDAELDALLSTPLMKPLKKEEEDTKQLDAKEEPPINIKKEDLETSELLPNGVKLAVMEHSVGTTIKEEPDNGSSDPVVVFKKRKPKNIRQK